MKIDDQVSKLIIQTLEIIITTIQAVKYGQLLSCSEGEECRYCLVQPMSPVCESGIHLKNEFDCPMYTLSFSVLVIPSSVISSPVNFVHQCQPSCTLTNKRVSVVVESESSSTSKFMITETVNSVLIYFV